MVHLVAGRAADFPACRWQRGLAYLQLGQEGAQSHSTVPGTPVARERCSKTWVQTSWVMSPNVRCVSLTLERVGLETVIPKGTLIDTS